MQSICLLNAIPMKCKVCECDSCTFAKAIVLGKHDVDYFQCSNCGFVQTEEPYWLEEAYSDAIAGTDVGLVFRNNGLSQKAAHIIFNLFNHDAKFLDYGGGYGLFVRMMRDLGFDFYWFDKFCTNLFAKGFELNEATRDSYELVTAFEVFEHFVNPIEEIENILNFSRNILFSTELLPENNPLPNEWWYYAPQEGQHISIYTLNTLSVIADKYDLNLYSYGSSLHLLTEKEISPDLFNTILQSRTQELNKNSLLQSDYLKAVRKFINSNYSNSVTFGKEFHDSSRKNPQVLVDAVFFQINQTGIARVWKSLLEEWANNGFANYILVLDRAGTAPKIPGIRYRTVPPYDHNNTDADREMLQQVCDEEGADLFISSYYTTPITTTSVFMAYDMIPEVIGWDINNPVWQAKHQSIQHASAYIAISENTARDLVRFFSDIPLESVTIAYCGVKITFSPAKPEEVNAFKIKYGISKPYFILVGTGSAYKNSILFFKAFSQLASSCGFDIVCTGSGGLLAPELRTYTSGSAVHMLQLSDVELVTAYSGAVALIYPSKYEGFGMPVVEAMACGCPVITCPNASIPEVAGKAAIYVNDDDVEGLVNALCEVQKLSVRNSLIAAGLEQAKQFSWSKMAKTVSSALIEATLLPLKLKETNLIVFPDWSQPEEVLGSELERVIGKLATHPNSQHITLLLDTSNSIEQYAELLLSALSMNLLMQEDLDVSEGLEISLIGQLSDIQWEAFLPHIKARIVLENENKQAVAQAKAETLPCFEKEYSKQPICITPFEKNIFDTLVEEFNEKTKFIHRLSSIVHIYIREQLDPSLLEEFHFLRKQMAELWLGTEENLLERLYLSKVGEAYQALLNSGIQYEPLTETEQNFVSQTVAQLAKGFEEPKAVQYLLIAMLYCLPHQLPFTYDLTHIPNWLLNDYLGFTLKPPLYFREIGEADSYYQYMKRWVKYLHSNIVNDYDSELWQDVASYFTQTANFIFLYFNNFNLKDIYTNRAEIIQSFLKKFNNIDYEFPERSSERNKIRLGILASHFGLQTETFATLSVYKHLNRDLFEIILFTFNVSNHRLERYCAGHADTLIQLPADLVSQVQSIRETELDLLFISTNVTAVTHQITLLASHRLARIQIVDANSPVTTGMRHIDYYISSKLSEPEENAQQHYTETLVTLDSPPQCFDFATEEQILATTSISRENLGIAKHSVVYVSGANYYKIIPELEVAWAKIIASIPDSVLLLYPFNPNWSSSYPAIAFQKRIAATFAQHGIPQDRLIFLDCAPNRADVKERLKLGDIYLDSYPYSGMTSLLDPLEVGLPTVLMETEPSRSRKGASLLRELQIPDLITNSEEAYIHLAVALGTDFELRQQKAEQIKQKMQENPRFIDSRSYSAKIGELFQELFQKHQAIAIKDQFKLRDINLIIFPDWSQPEEFIIFDLERVIKALATHPESQKTTLLIDISNISSEDAELLLSAVMMNLVIQEDLDASEGLEVSLVGQFNEMQSEALLPHIKARIVLEYENKQAVAQAKAETLPFFEVENLTDTQNGQFFLNLSNKLFHQGRWQEAIAQYQKLLEIKAGDSDVYWRLNECYRQLNLLDEAFNILREGIKLYPKDGNLHFSLIINLLHIGRTQEAISSAIAASNSLPDDYTFKLLKYLIVPMLYDTHDEISFYRERFTQGLGDLIQETSLETTEEKQNALAGIGRFTNFYLSYQAQNDIELQRQYGNLVHEIMAANYPQWIAPLSMPNLKPDNKIRIGYVSHYLHSYSGTLWLTGWLRHCDRQSFEIYCYYTGNSPDPITQQFQDDSDVFHHIPHNLAAACEQIIADQLHILIYPEIGMDAQTMQMAGLRLAPVQCVAWGHPVTTGLPTIDYFLSSELMEPENAQEHYSEKLIRLPNIGVSYPKPYIPPVSKTRSDYKLRDDAVVYLCCQAPFKYLPQYDFILAEIARRVPQATFVFLRGGLLQPRLSRAFAAVGLKSEDYCVFLTIPERLDYLMINLLSDVYLDTFTWSGGNTTLEAIACNLPIVTSPGEFMRGLHSYSFLKMLGVTDTIAQNEAEYIDIAVKLGLDPAWRRSVAERIKERHDHLYDDKTCVTGLEAFYKQLVHRSLQMNKIPKSESVQKDSKYQIGKYEIKIPPGFLLPNYQINFKLYDRFLPILVKQLTPDKLIIDVGANIGDTVVNLQYCKNPIVCIEPSDLFFSYLEENIANLRPDDYNRVKLLKKMVGTRLFSGKLIHSVGGTASVDITESPNTITHIELDQLIDDSFNVVLLKVDTDGFDFDVIKSAERILSDSRPILFWENAIFKDFQYKGFEELYPFLKEKGYKYVYIFDNYGNLITEEYDFETLKNINSYVYSMDKYGCTRTFYYTDILAATEEYGLIVKNAINEYKAEWINNGVVENME